MKQPLQRRFAMNTVATIICTAIVFGITTTGWTQTSDDAGKPYPDPKRFEGAIAKFEAADKKNPPPAGAILFLGSSSIRGWHRTVAEDMAPLTVIPRGFGGSNMNEALYFADRVALPYKPRAIVLYEGDNDVAQGVAPRKIADTFRAFVKKIHTELPETRIYFICIKPSIRRWSMWPNMVEANELIAAQCAKDKRLTYVDIATGMLGEDGQPRKDIFVKDNLHMNRPGYEIWRDALRPVLIKNEPRFETE